tara:strand:+ start:396 stop:599 length:204 start_codon:yes stop_codon:yes gene_type:complete
VNKKSEAQKHCANWDCGKCMGVLFIRGVDSGQIYQRVNKGYYNKECFVELKEGCQYFKNCVRPVLTQ